MAKLNEILSKIFYDMANILDTQNVQWKPQAYRRAARSLESQDDVSEIYYKNGIEGLLEIPGVGEAIAEKIVEYIKTKKIKAYEDLRKENKISSELIDLEGVGARRAKVLYDTLKIKTIKQLEKAAKDHKIRILVGFGEKSEEDILKNIELHKLERGRIPLNEILPVANKIVEDLKKNKFVLKIDVVGSIRRKKETVKDIDILIASNKPETVAAAFVNLPVVKRVLAKGKTRCSAILRNNLKCDIRIVKLNQYGSALLYFTGSKEFNVRLRILAIQKGYKLSEYGLFNKKTGKLIASKTEKEIFKKLGLGYISPELRKQ